MDAIAGARPARWRAPFFTLYRAGWCLLFAAALLFTGYVHPRDEAASQAKYQAFMRVGFAAWWNPSAAGQMGGPFGEPGRRAGYGDGDIMTAVDGRPMPLDTPGRIAAVAGPDGSLATLSLRRPDGSTYTTRIARSEAYEAEALAGSGITFSGRRWAVFAVDTLARLAALAAALLLFLRRPRDPVAGLLSGGLLLSCLGSINIATTLPALAPFLTSLNVVAIPVAILLFPDGRLSTPVHWFAIFWVIAGEILLDGWGPSLGLPWWTSTILSAAVYAYGTTILLIACSALQYRLTPPGAERLQVKFVLLGVVASALLQGVVGILDQNMYGEISEGLAAWLSLIKWTLAALSSLALSAGLLVSLLRFRLYDADSVVARSVAYGALTLSLLAVFAGSEKLIEALGETYFGETLGAMAGGLGAAVAAVMIVPLHHRISHWAERRFQEQVGQLRCGLPLLVGDLRETAGLERIAAAILDAASAGVRASRAALIVGDRLAAVREISAADLATWRAGWTPASSSGVDRVPGDPIFPLRVPLEADGHGRVGWLLLGPRPDGSIPGRDEREALGEIADPVARALGIVLLREAREAELGALIGGLNARLAAVEAALARPAGPELART